jgi:predicted outer membrane repeat protein
VRLAGSTAIRRFRAAILGVGAGLLLVPAVAVAKAYTVTTLKDPAPNGCTKKSCSMREATIASNASVGVKDTIVLPSKGPYKLKIPPAPPDDETTGDLDLTDPANIKHPGKGTATIDAQKIDRVIFADIPPTFTEVYTKLKRITITGGKTTSDQGGGLKLGVALLGLDHSKVVGNSAEFGGGGIYAAQGELTLKDSTISGNRNANSQGGGVSTSVDTLIEGTTISGNRITGSGNGGGLFASVPNKLTMRNDTIAGNSTTLNGGGIAFAGPADLNNVTVTDNKADSDNSNSGVGGGLYSQFDNEVTVGNSIVFGNTDGATGTDPDCSGTFDSAGRNLVNDSDDCNGFNTPGDLFPLRAKLGKLADNGGPTKTVALKKGSPAIGKASKKTSEARDQRGRKRDKHPDIGAYEYGAKP